MPAPPSKPPNSPGFRFTPRRADAAALLSGLALTLAFAPFSLFPLAALAPAALFLLWRGCAPGRAAWRGFLFGLGLFASGVSWVYVSLHNFGNMPAPLAGFTVLLFVAFLALYPAAVGAVQARLFRDRGLWPWLLGLPALWTLFEWLRGWVLSGFPWLNLGYAQVDTPLAGLAPVLGVYGVSLATALSAALLAALVHHHRRWPWLLSGLVLLWGLGGALDRVTWVRPAGGPLQAALVQGNIPLGLKWAPGAAPRILKHYRDLSAEAHGAGLIIWPEAAVPMYREAVPPAYWSALRELARVSGADFLIGVPERVQEESGRRSYNSLISLGRSEGVYRKRHLVPFGEFLPLRPLLGWLLEYLRIPMSDFSPGKGPNLLQAAGQPVAVSICYEDAFGEELIDALPQATLLVNVSEDAWFGDSLAPHQRVQMARMRARESGRPLLRAANTGPSVAVDHRGRVLALTPQFIPRLLQVQVRPMSGATPYVRLGNAGPLGLVLVVLLAALLLSRRGAKDTPGP